ncbi:MAG: hypothetical protein IPM49_00975 [Flavobacteriales bacterium]|nr:hypothetical protein [Flavobacteriales bacterium]
MEQNLRTPLAAFLFAIALVSAQAQALSDSLLAHFPLDGNPNDVIGGLAPTDSAGTPSFCPDRFNAANGAACFDGSSFWSYGDVLDMDTNDFAVSFWFQADTVPQYPVGSRIVSKGGTVSGTTVNSGWGTLINGFGGDSARIELFTGDANSAVDTVESAFDIGAWVHVLMNRCDTSLSLYLNGSLLDQRYSAPDRDLSANIVFAIGALDRSPSQDPDGSFFQGAVDDIRIFKGRCLSQTEIDTLYYGISVPVSDLPRALDLRIQPNPVTDQLVILTSLPLDGSSVLNITDAMGRVVSSKALGWLRTPPAAGITVNVAGLMPGTYWVSLVGTRYKAFGRFIKL